MKCDRCGADIEAGDENEHLGQTLCEDCYMDALSPVRVCDPWAVHSAASLERHSGGAVVLTQAQSEILDIMEETGGLEPQALLQRLSHTKTMKELERDFAALRHMEKVRGEKQGDRVIWRLWG